MCDKEGISSLFSEFKPDRVVNLAAQAGVRYSIENPMIYINSNIVGFGNILENCKLHNISHLLYASSSSVYGGNTTMPFSIHDNVDHPLSLYAASKKSNELMAHTYSHLYKLPTTGLRFFTVYGPWGRPDRALFKFSKAILNDKPINVFNFGNHQRDSTIIDDIVCVLIKILDKPALLNKNWNSKKPDPGSSNAPWRIYNVGSNNPIKLMDFINAIEKALGKKAVINYLPLQPGDVPETYANVDDLVNEFHYKPNTNIVDGITKFMSWYREYFNL